jgi:flagellar hook-associated protein 3 FlgL
MSSSVKEYAQQVFTLLNTQQGDQYLFGGTSGNVAPVTTITGGVGYTLTSATGLSSSIQYQVAQGVEININVSAYSILGATLSGGSSSTATLQSTLQQVSQDIALGTSSNLSNDLQNLNAAMGNVTNNTADLGARMQRMTAIQTQMSQYTATLTNEKGVIEDANMAQVITQFNTDQISYQAALKMGSQILLPTLVSFLPSG